MLRLAGLGGTEVVALRKLPFKSCPAGSVLAGLLGGGR